MRGCMTASAVNAGDCIDCATGSVGSALAAGYYLECAWRTSYKLLLLVLLLCCCHTL
jgi:hypothetical protein